MPKRLTIAVAIEKLSVLCYQRNIIEQECLSRPLTGLRVGQVRAIKSIRFIKSY